MNFQSMCVVHAFVFAMTIISFGELAIAQEPGPSTQKWQGTIETKTQTLQLNFDVTRDEKGNFSGKIISVDQGSFEFPITSMNIDGNNVVVKADSPRIIYEGTLNDDRTVIRGTWKQGASEVPLEIRRVDEFETAKHIESWKGTLVAGTRRFPFRLRIFEKADGKLSAKLDSPSESISGLRLKLHREDRKLEFEVVHSGARFVGEVNEAGDTIKGNWIQSGNEFPLEFESIELDAAIELHRPQHPTAPFPYRRRTVTFKNETDGVQLSGTLTIPRGEGPFPAAVLISGSGPQDRDSTVFEHKPFLVIADHLSRNGIAVLRFDDRGTGKSTGDFVSAATHDFATDVRSAVDFLQARKEIDTEQIGLIGHSEGALIAPLVAAECDEIAFIVLLAGPGVDGGEIVISQSRAMGEAAGLDAKFLAAQEALQRKLFDRIRESDSKLSKEFLDETFDEFANAAAETGSESVIQGVRPALNAMNTNWYREFVRLDPQIALRKVKCPILALNGTKDIQVLADLNTAAIDRALTDSKHSDFEVRKLESLNHLFQETSGTGAVSDYAGIDQTFSPIALKMISEWIRQRTIK